MLVTPLAVPLSSAIELALWHVYVVRCAFQTASVGRQSFVDGRLVGRDDVAAAAAAESNKRRRRRRQCRHERVVRTSRTSSRLQEPRGTARVPQVTQRLLLSGRQAEVRA